ncbi:MAG: GIY-YIG nuclease family protein [Patescibacteria group bacterium]
MQKQYYVYIMGSISLTLYVGVTNDLIRRVYQHKEGLVDGFTKKYNIKHLLYFDSCSDINSAITKEKQIKKWNREWKLNLIRKDNPEMRDLYSEIISS